MTTKKSADPIIVGGFLYEDTPTGKEQMTTKKPTSENLGRMQSKDGRYLVTCALWVTIDDINTYEIGIRDTRKSVGDEGHFTLIQSDFLTAANVCDFGNAFAAILSLGIEIQPSEIGAFLLGAEE